MSKSLLDIILSPEVFQVIITAFRSNKNHCCCDSTSDNNGLQQHRGVRTSQHKGIGIGQGTKYVEESVVVLDSAGILSIFGMITNILLIKSDEPYFVCEVLNTKEFYSHSYSFIVQRTKPISIAFCKPGDLSDHTIGSYSLRHSLKTAKTHYIVPQYHIM